MYKLTEQTDIKDEIRVETVEVLRWNLIVDILEHPYSQKDPIFWENYEIHENDCASFFINFTNTQNPYPVTFTIIDLSENNSYLFEEEFPLYRSQDIFKHQFQGTGIPIN